MAIGSTGGSPWSPTPSKGVEFCASLLGIAFAAALPAGAPSRRGSLSGKTLCELPAEAIRGSRRSRGAPVVGLLVSCGVLGAGRLVSSGVLGDGLRLPADGRSLGELLLLLLRERLRPGFIIMMKIPTVAIMFKHSNMMRASKSMPALTGVRPTLL